MRTLVTGATGFLGSHIVERLLAQGHEVHALARRTSDLSHLRTTSAAIVFGDVEDYDSLVPALRGIDVVYHAAARVTPGWGSWKQFRASIVEGTENMLRASAVAGVSRFLHVSTGSVHGKACEGAVPATESTPCEVEFCPDTYYDCAKLEAEKIAFDYHNKGKLPVSMIRIATVYGPRDRLLADRVYRHMSTRIIFWPGRANPRYSIVHVTEAADFAVLAATSDIAAGRVYNVAPPHEIRFRDFAAAMIKAIGGPRVQVTIPYALGYIWCALMEGWSRLRNVQEMPYLTRSGLRFLNRGLYLDGTRAREELGWEPRLSMEEGTRLYVQWRRDHQKICLPAECVHSLGQ
ncbi:MAG: NAD-dependent epimerase/dehydratase family protein [Dehalococcoidia bacterium]|nr:NAD-dependent epimerase/dehydratase family protein [Dehalococcoidia bacterium]